MNVYYNFTQPIFEPRWILLYQLSILWKGVFSNSSKTISSWMLACVKWSGTTLSFLGFPQFWDIPNPPLFGCGCFFCDPNINSQFREELNKYVVLFFGGGVEWRSCWSTNVFRRFYWFATSEAMLLVSGRFGKEKRTKLGVPVMFGFIRGVKV